MESRRSHKDVRSRLLFITFSVQYGPTHKKHLFCDCPRGCKRNFFIHHFLLLAKNIAPLSYFPRFSFQRSNFLLLLTAVIAFFLSILWSLPFSRRIFVASTSPVHCGTPLPDFDTFRGTGRWRISQLYRYVCTVRTDRRPFLVSTSNPISYVVSYHREHDIDRFLATPFLIVLLLLSAISYGLFLIFSKI